MLEMKHENVVLVMHTPAFAKFLCILGNGSIWFHFVIRLSAIKVSTQTFHSPFIKERQNDIYRIKRSASVNRIEMWLTQWIKDSLPVLQCPLNFTDRPKSVFR